MTKPRAETPQHLFQTQHALGLANRAAELTGHASGVLLNWVVKDGGYTTFSNRTLAKRWNTGKAVRYVTCFYGGVLDTLADAGAPMHPDTRERLAAIREAVNTPSETSPTAQREQRRLGLFYNEGVEWATDYLDRVKENEA